MVLHYSNKCRAVFLYLFLKLFVQCSSSGWRNYICKELTIYKFMGEIGSKQIISTMQGDDTIT